MSLSTFLIATLITVGITIFIRFFWYQLFIIWTILRALFWITVTSAVSAVIWMVCTTDSTNTDTSGIGLCWLYFFILYSCIFILFIFITLDIYTYFRGFIRDLFKK